MKRKMCFCLLCIVLFSPTVLSAEIVKPLNPDCAICPVVISFEGKEAKKLLGNGGKALILKLSNIENKTFKIDMDGVRKPGSEIDSNKGYELLVSVYPDFIAINCIQDESSIKIETDHKQLKAGTSDSWSPEIQLGSAEAKIQKDDDLEIAWEKVKMGKLYQYISSMGKAELNENMSVFIHKVLKTASEM